MGAGFREAYRALPDDEDAAAFYALAHLAVVPPNVISRKNADESAAILLGIYQKNPDHPGAMHYLVHANDVPGREHEELEITNKYENAAPDNPHALHMPTHIYTRLGDWDGVIRGNLLAANAALEIRPANTANSCGTSFRTPSSTSCTPTCRKATTSTRGHSAIACGVQKNWNPASRRRFTSRPRVHATRSSGRTGRSGGHPGARTGSLAWDKYPWAEAISRFARGLGAAHLGQLDHARAESLRLAELDANATKAGEELFARNIRVLRLELDAWTAQAEKRPGAGVSLMQQAADLETSTPKPPVTPAPTLPAYELLGDLWMAQEQPDKALAAYRHSLELYPNRSNSLRGVAQAQKAIQP